MRSGTVAAAITFAMLCAAAAFAAEAGGAFDGRVVEAESGAPIAGAVVFVEAVELSPGAPDTSVDAAETVTDAAGAFHLSGPIASAPRGAGALRHLVTVFKAGYTDLEAFDWSAFAVAGVILEKLSPAERTTPEAGCDRAASDVRLVLGCDARPSKRPKTTVRLEAGMPIFKLRRITRAHDRVENIPSVNPKLPPEKSRFLEREKARGELIR